MLAGGESESATPEIIQPCESGRKAQTWFFRALVCLKDGQTFSNLLDARKQQLETSLAAASVISWACVNTMLLENQDSNCVYLEGFVHASTNIRLGSLQRVLPEKQETDAGEIVEVAFQDVKPGLGKDYMCHPTVKAFLEKTSLDPLASDKRKRVDYRGSSASNFQLIRANTWFGRGTMVCSDPSQVEAIFRSENVAQRQAATLSSSEVITFACAGPRATESSSNVLNQHSA